MARTRTDALLLGEWACLGILSQAPAHGYDVSVRLGPTGDVGRVWGLSRSLTYRALDQLGQRALIVAVGEERGKAGGQRTILAPTRAGRARLVVALGESAAGEGATVDPVAAWRYVSSRAVLRFLDRMLADRSDGATGPGPPRPRRKR